MASGCEYIIKGPCPTSNTKSPLPLSKKKKSSLHLFQLLTIDIDTQRRPKMWYHEVSGTATTTTTKKAKYCVILCLPFKGGALR